MKVMPASAVTSERNCAAHLTASTPKKSTAKISLRILTRLMTLSARLYFWRTLEGNEVDFVIEYGRRLLAIEVKLTDNLGYRDTAGIRLFLEKHPKASGGVIVYGGKEIKRLDKKIVAIPWSLVTG